MNFKNTSNSIYAEIKNKLVEQRLFEIDKAYKKFKQGEELEKTLEQIEEEFVFNLFKLEEILFLKTRTDEVKKNFLEQKIYIDNANISFFEKICLTLTTACIFTHIYELIKNLTNEELYLLGICMQNIGLNQYYAYGKVLADKRFMVRKYGLSKINTSELNFAEEAFLSCNNPLISDSVCQKIMHLGTQNANK